MNNIEFKIEYFDYEEDGKYRHEYSLDRLHLELSDMYTSAQGETKEIAINELNDKIYERVQHLENVIKGLQKVQALILTNNHNE